MIVFSLKYFKNLKKRFNRLLPAKKKNSQKNSFKFWEGYKSGIKIIGPRVKEICV